MTGPELERDRGPARPVDSRLCAGALRSQNALCGNPRRSLPQQDAGATWTQISPPGSREIHEVESLAVDPVDPNIVYAGTWHLPWKTTDGGKTWHNIKQGLIDDSDVFSIMSIRPSRSTVFLSACSGIYKSENAANCSTRSRAFPLRRAGRAC
jgi:photosystem II stability/assembly factor-like uncharacterized protein